MAHDAIKITDLRTEIMTLVNSDPVKYDPNNNGKIDAGNELSQLLSEYQCTSADLTANDGKKMWSLAEQKEINERGKENSKSSRRNIKLFSAAGVATGLGASAYFIKKGIQNVTEQVKFQKTIDVEKLVADGSYTPGARTAADVYSKYTKRPFMKMDVNGCFANKGQRCFVNVQELADSSFPTYDVALKPNGFYVGLRDWKPGDPQFVKHGTRVVDDYKMVTKRVFNTKLLKKGGLIGVGTLAFGILTEFVGSKIAQKSAENRVKLDIKAAQTADSERIMQQRAKHEEEIRQREAALKQEELEYRERMYNATQGVDARLQSAERRARNINQELKEAETIITPDTTTVAN